MARPEYSKGVMDRVSTPFISQGVPHSEGGQVSQEASPLFCARCARELCPGAGDFYEVTIDAIADPSPPVVEKDESAAELRRQIEALLNDMQDLSAREALDQVHRRLVLHLCLACYVNWIENPVG